jgi:hypothetical protein
MLCNYLQLQRKNSAQVLLDSGLDFELLDQFFFLSFFHNLFSLFAFIHMRQPPTEEGATAPSLKRENPLQRLLGGSWATGHRRVESLKSNSNQPKPIQHSPKSSVMAMFMLKGAKQRRGTIMKTKE